MYGLFYLLRVCGSECWGFALQCFSFLIIDTLYVVVCCDGQHLCKGECINTDDDKDKDCVPNKKVKYNTQTLHNKYISLHAPYTNQQCNCINIIVNSMWFFFI